MEIVTYKTVNSFPLNMKIYYPDRFIENHVFPLIVFFLEVVGSREIMSNSTVKQNISAKKDLLQYAPSIESIQSIVRHHLKLLTTQWML